MSVFDLYAILLLLNFTVTVAADREQAPLEIIWHVPTRGNAGCETRYGVPIDVGQYGMLENSNPGTTGTVGEVITILYRKQLGRWPYLHKTSDGTLEMIDGGLPQVEW